MALREFAETASLVSVGAPRLGEIVLFPTIPDPEPEASVEQPPQYEYIPRPVLHPAVQLEPHHYPKWVEEYVNQHELFSPTDHEPALQFESPAMRGKRELDQLTREQGMPEFGALPEVSADYTN